MNSDTEIRHPAIIAACQHHKTMGVASDVVKTAEAFYQFMITRRAPAYAPPDHGKLTTSDYLAA